MIKSKPLLIVAVVFAALLGALGGYVAMKYLFARTELLMANPFPRGSPLYAPFQRMIENMSSVPEIRAAFKDTRNAEEAFAKGMQLSRKGVKKLDDARLQRRVEIMSRISDRVDLGICATIARGDVRDVNAFQRKFYDALARLDQETIESWVDMAYAAMLAELRQLPDIALESQQAQAAMQALVDKLPGQDGARLIKVLNHLNSATDEDACWVGKTLYRETLQLDPENRRTLSRALAQG